MRGLQQRLQEDELKLELLRTQIKAALDALDHGAFTEVEDADLDATLDRLTSPVTDKAYRLSDPAKADIAAVLRTSERLHGADARVRYRALLTPAIRRIAAEPQGRSTVDRSELAAAVRSFHIQHSRNESREAAVGDPVHVIFYRAPSAPT